MFSVVLAGVLFSSGLIPQAQAPNQEQDALLKMVDELAKTTEELRGLKFKTPVKKGIKNKEQLRAYIAKEMAEEMPPAKLKVQQEVYTRVGLLPQGYDLEKGVLDLLTGAVAGFYDPKTKEFFLIEGFASSMQKVTIVHELTHALDDQHFDLQKMMDEVKEHEDKSLGVRAVVEGSGTLIMSRYQIQSLALIAEMAKDMEGMKEMMDEQSDLMKKAPPYLVRTLVAAYVLGQKFLNRGDLNFGVRRKGEQDDWKRAFENPPASSEQVLHPEKYWDPEKRDEPVPVSIPSLEGILGEGWTKSGSDTLGEFAIAVLTRDPDDDEEFHDASEMMNLEWTNEAASGWGGDQYAIWQNGSETVLAWLIHWDTEADTRQFVKRYRPPMPARVFVHGKAVLMLWGVEDEKKSGLIERLLIP